MTQIVICGGPRCGKTTLAKKLSRAENVLQFHTDNLMHEHDWSGVSLYMAQTWLSIESSWVIEGVAAVRGLRKWLKHNVRGKPCDLVIWLDEPLDTRTNGQVSMGKAVTTIWREIEDELRGRGVTIQHGAKP